MGKNPSLQSGFSSLQIPAGKAASLDHWLLTEETLTPLLCAYVLLKNPVEVLVFLTS